MRHKIIPYNAGLKELARKLRNDSTLGEVLLWNELRNGSLLGYDFHRQKPLLNYIVDFYCRELKLIIEIDGRYHSTAEMDNADRIRDQELKKYNLTTLRFTEGEVKQDLFNVLKSIETYIYHYPNKDNVNP